MNTKIFSLPFSFSVFLLLLVGAPVAKAELLATDWYGASGCEYIVEPGDHLSKIAQWALGDANRWREIRDANPGKVGEGNIILIGARLNIPCDVDNDNGVNLDATATHTATYSAKSTGQPIEVWTAQEGQNFSTVLKEWSEKAGYRLVIRTEADWRFSVAFSHEGSFRSALREIARGFTGEGEPGPSVVLYDNNVIILN